MATNLYRYGGGVPTDDTPTAGSHYPVESGALKTILDGLNRVAVKVPEASGANVTKAEFKALLDALKDAGLMAKE